MGNVNLSSGVNALVRWATMEPDVPNVRSPMRQKKKRIGAGHCFVSFIIFSKKILLVPITQEVKKKTRVNCPSSSIPLVLTHTAQQVSS